MYDTIPKQKEESDLHQLKRAYLKYENYIRQHGGDSEKGMIAVVLSEVLRAITSRTGLEIIADTEAVDANSDLYQAYNILPLDPGGEHQAIMQLPEIKAAVTAVRNTRGLPSVEGHHLLIYSIGCSVCLDFRKEMFPTNGSI